MTDARYITAYQLGKMLIEQDKNNEMPVSMCVVDVEDEDGPRGVGELLPEDVRLTIKGSDNDAGAPQIVRLWVRVYFYDGMPTGGPYCLCRTQALSGTTAARQGSGG